MNEQKRINVCKKIFVLFKLMQRKANGIKTYENIISSNCEAYSKSKGRFVIKKNYNHI